MDQKITGGSGAALMDGAAFESLFRRFYPLAFAVAIGITHNAADADDVVQSVFCKIWASRPAIGKATASWLFIVTRNAAIDHLRRIRQQCFDFALRRAIENVVPSAEEEALKNIECGELARALEQLGNQSAELLLESFLENHSHAAIASRSALPLGTVKTRIRAGLKRARGLMTLGYTPADHVKTQPAQARHIWQDSPFETKAEARSFHSRLY